MPRMQVTTRRRKYSCSNTSPYPTLSDIQQCGQIGTDPEGPCLRCMTLSSIGIRRTSGDKVPRSPYMGCFRVDFGAHLFFHVTAQAALTRTQLSILEDEVCLPTGEGTGVAAITYHDGPAFQAEVGLYSDKHGVDVPPQIGLLAICHVETAKSGYRDYLMANACAAVRAGAHQPTVTCSDSEGIIASLLAIATRHAAILGPPSRHDIFSKRSEAKLEQAEPQNILHAVFPLCLAMRE